MSDPIPGIGGNGAGGGLIEPVDLHVEVERSFLDYAMSVIVMRALPDARDGLKPVHRRILYSMEENGFRPDRAHVKSARVVGEVIAKYHPHSPDAVYDALVRMAQNFSLRDRLIHPQGNFGSPDDPPAAFRYTECRLEALAMHMVDGLDEDTVDFVENFSGDEVQPTVLPARFPNLLVNGSQGIAVGMATNIPTHNLGEVIDATIHLLESPDATSDDLMQFVKGPDFPTGGLILGRQGILDAYRTGRGSIRLRARASIEESKRGFSIVVTEVPYQTSVGTIAGKIADLVNSKQLEGIRNVNDESAKGKTRLVVDLKRDANANVVMNNLFKHTPMQTSFPVNMVALVDHDAQGRGVPRTLNLQQALAAYIGHQVEVIRRRCEFRLRKAQERIHLVEGLLRALDLIDEIIVLIRGSENRAAAKVGLVGTFEFSELQADYILDTTLARLTRLARSELIAEVEELKTKIKELESILASDAKLRGVISTELSAIRTKFATDRKTEITFDPGEMDITDLIADEPVVVTMTKAGYMKAVAIESFRTQGRGGRGVAGTKLRDEDLVVDVLHTTTHANLLLFSNRGKVYRLAVHEVPRKERTARGTPAVNLVPLEAEERIQAVITTREFPQDRFLFFATKRGVVKKTAFGEYDKSRREGFIAINLRKDDELVRVIETSGADDMLIISNKGQGIRFSEANVRPTGRSAAGVRGIRLKADHAVVSCDPIGTDGAVLMVTESGYGKRTLVEKFNRQARGGQGSRAIKLTAKKGYVVDAFIVGIDDEIMLVSSGGVTMRIAVRGISCQGRTATGVRIMNLDKGQSVAAATRILPDA